MDRKTLYLLLALALLAGGIWGGARVLDQSENRKKWTPALAAAEQCYGLPAGLLVRQAQEESSFLSANINGTNPSSAGALGILQLEPAYFASVRAPVPFSDAATSAQIAQAAQEMARLYGLYGSWALALAAYNWGEQNVNNWLGTGGALPPETVKYVSDIVADVPAANDSGLLA